MNAEPIVHVAVVSRDPALRMEVARAFDAAPPSWDVTMYEEAPADADVTVATPEVDCPGALAFDPSRPEDIITEVAAATSVQGRVIAVTSPAGGTGVTTVALHLAALAARRSTTCFVDLDTTWTACDRLGLPGDARTWAEARDSHGTLEQIALPIAPGLRALLAPRGRSAADRHRIPSLAAQSFERVVVDAPPGGYIRPVLEEAYCCVLVVPPTIPSARRAHEFLEAHHDLRWAVVINRLGPGGELTRSGLRRVMGCRIAVELPCCPSLRDREDEGALLSTAWSRWARGLRRLDHALEGA
jgi:Flp pilus assembly CpaE family ATPase